MGDGPPANGWQQTAEERRNLAATFAATRSARGDEAVLTVREAARRLGLCTKLVYDLCARGELAHYRLSNAIRIPGSALATYLEQAASKR